MKTTTVKETEKKRFERNRMTCRGKKKHLDYLSEIYCNL